MKVCAELGEPDLSQFHAGWTLGRTDGRCLGDRYCGLLLLVPLVAGDRYCGLLLLVPLVLLVAGDRYCGIYCARAPAARHKLPPLQHTQFTRKLRVILKN